MSIRVKIGKVVKKNLSSLSVALALSLLVIEMQWQ